MGLGSGECSVFKDLSLFAVSLGEQFLICHMIVVMLLSSRSSYFILNMKALGYLKLLGASQLIT